MIRGRWPIALGASLLLHTLIFAAATRLASSQAPTKPEFVELELVNFVARVGAAKPLVDTVPKPAPKPKSKSPKPIRKQPVKSISPSAKTTVTKTVTPPLPTANRVLKKTETPSDNKPLEEPVAVIPPLPEGIDGAAVTIEGANLTTAVDMQVSAETEAVDQSVERPGSDHSPRAGNVGGGITVRGPSVIYGPRPDYPETARVKGWTGKLKAKVLISELGMVKGAVIALSSGHSCLDAAALKKLRCWRFLPAYQNGRAIETWVVIPIEFKLD